jgi:predicted nucleic acid-binding protein
MTCKLTIPDALIAATAIVQDLELVTDNDRHFKMIPELAVSRPY